MWNLVKMRNFIWQGLSVVGVQQIDRVVDVVEETLKGNIINSFCSYQMIFNRKKIKFHNF